MRAGGAIELGEAARPLRAGVGAADPDIVGGLLGQRVQRGIAGEAEDLLDAVLFAPVIASRRP